MSETDMPLASTTEPNAGSPSVPSSINMPDHEVRQEKWYQVYVRLARPTLDWATIGWFAWVTILEPVVKDRFDSTAAPMCLVWCATVYGFKFAEKIKGVA
jgi:hypothetical protein